MNKQIIKELKTLLKDLLTELKKYKEKPTRFTDRIVIHLTERQSTAQEYLNELKLDLIEQDNDIEHDKILLVMKNLQYFNAHLANKELRSFIAELIDFNKYYVELYEIWKTVEWRYFYTIFDNKLMIYSNKKAIVRSMDIAEINNVLEELKKIITKKSREAYERKMLKKLNKLISEAAMLIQHLDFVKTFADLYKEITGSLIKSLKQQWDELIGKNELTKSDQAVLAFVLRLSIETSLKNHPIILSDTSQKNKMLGQLFKRLQDEDVFRDEKDEIKKQLAPLNKAVHGEGVHLTRSELIATKEYFKSIFAFIKR
jgi:hypothetical protein